MEEVTHSAQLELLGGDPELWKATCEAGDWSLTDSFNMVMIGHRDHFMEKEHGVVLNE